MGFGNTNAAAGGTSLNFKVVGGTTEPTNHKENMIWVNTSNKITGWYFSATQPRLRSNNKNLICYPFIYASRTVSGITFTDLGDGSIAIKGTATANAYYHLCNIDLGNKYFNSNSVPGGYVISGLVSGVTLEYKSDSDGLLHLTILNGTTVSATVRPQIEKGSAATSFVKGDATGQVWIVTGTSIQMEFNALKKNGITVYPMTTKQYVNGAWVDKTTKIYQNGTWNTFELKRWIYNNGTESYNMKTVKYTEQASIGVYTNNGNSFTITAEGKDTSIARVTEDAIDLTPFSRLQIKATKTGAQNNVSNVFVMTKGATVPQLSSRALCAIGSGTSYVVDISAVNEPCQIGVGVATSDSASQTNIIVTEMYLE